MKSPDLTKKKNGFFQSHQVTKTSMTTLAYKNLFVIRIWIRATTNDHKTRIIEL